VPHRHRGGSKSGPSSVNHANRQEATKSIFTMKGMKGLEFRPFMSFMLFMVKSGTWDEARSDHAFRATGCTNNHPLREGAQRPSCDFVDKPI